MGGTDLFIYKPGILFGEEKIFHAERERENATLASREITFKSEFDKEYHKKCQETKESR